MLLNQVYESKNIIQQMSNRLLDSQLTLTVTRSLVSCPGLFDYESPARKKTVFFKTIKQNSYLYIDSCNPEKQIELLELHSAIMGLASATGCLVLVLKRKNQQFFLNKAEGESEERLFVSLRNKKIGHPLCVNDTIKFGRLEFKVRDICIDRQMELQDCVPLAVRAVNQVNEGSCRICLSQEGPFITPCRCKGSCENVHLECLQEWMKSRVKSTKGPYVEWLHIGKLECEICKEALPRAITVNGKSQDLLKVVEPQGAFIVLESNQAKSLVIIRGKEGKKVAVGRGQDSHLHLVDSSVSRIHASIQLIDGRFHLRDTESKFGTLVCVGGNMKIEQKTEIQFGDLLFSLEMEGSKDVRRAVYELE